MTAGNALISLGSTPTTKPIETSATITTDTNLYNRAATSFYSLSPNGMYKYYRGIYRSDVAIECIQGSYSRVDDKNILLGGDYTYFAKQSTNVFKIGTDKFDVIPGNKLPSKCLPSIKASLVSFNNVNTNGNYDDFSFVYSSKKSNKLILQSYGVNKIFNTVDNKLSTFSAVPPPQPTNPVPPTYPGAPPTPPSQPPNGRYYYPVSINNEFDYWMYHDYNNNKCKLVSSTNTTDVITLPGNYGCFDGYITIGDNGNIYGRDYFTSSIITVNTKTQQVTSSFYIPLSGFRSMTYLGNNKILVGSGTDLIIDIATKTYVSYSTTSFNSILPKDCSEDFSMAIGNTQSGLVSYVNCYAMGTDGVMKFTIN